MYVGVDDLKDEHKDENKKFLVDFVIRHRDSYPGDSLIPAILYLKQ